MTLEEAFELCKAPVPPDADSLFEYGIWQDQSDIRIHVSPKNGQACVYETVVMQRYTKSNEGTFRVWYGSQRVEGRTVTTSRVLLVPTANLAWVHWLIPSQDLMREALEAIKSQGNGLGIRGRAVERFARKTLEASPWWTWPITQRGKRLVEELPGRRDQLRAHDLRVSLSLNVQVKCDQPMTREGNVAVQTHERNPHKIR